MVKKTDIVLPDDIYNIFLKPLAQKMGIRYLPRNSGLLLRSIFKKLSERAEDLDTKKLKEIKKSVEKIIGPVSTFMEIIGTLAKPLFAVIPPQYALPILAVILVPTVFIPMMIIGLVVLSFLEKSLKVPFVKSQRDIDKIPIPLQNTMLDITQISKRTVTMLLKKWLDFDAVDRLDYFYESRGEIKDQLRLIEKILEIEPNVTSITIHPWLARFRDSLPEELRGIELNLEQEITLIKHTYRGWRTILPPIVTRSVEIVREIFARVGENALTDFAEHPARAVAKYFFIGWWGFLGKKD